MVLLIVAATEAEIMPLLASLVYKEQKSLCVMSYFINNTKIDVLITGIGMVATTYWLTKALQQEKYSLVINAGIAGSFKSTPKIGEVVYVNSETFSELGAEDGDDFLDLIKLNLVAENEFPFKKNCILNSTIFKLETIKELPIVDAITVNKVHGNEKNIAATKMLYNPDIESMEGAAVFYCCSQEHLDFMQIRGISNKITLRDKSKWDIPLAIKNLNSVLLKIIKEKLNKKN